MRFQEALGEIAHNMAVAQNSSMSVQHYQNSITPPWLVRLWILLVVALVSCLAMAWYREGLGITVLTAASFLVGMLLSGLGSQFIGCPSFKTYCRYTFHSLVNREADYRREGDHMRGNAVQQFRELLAMIVGHGVAK